MRIAVVALAVVGAMAAGFLGQKWVRDAAKHRELVREVAKLGIAPDAVKEVGRIETAGYLLLGSMLAGFGGAAAAFLRKGKVAGAVLLAAALVPALFSAKALVFTIFLLAAGGLSFLLKPEGVSVREQAEMFLKRRTA